MIIFNNFQFLVQLNLVLSLNTHLVNVQLALNFINQNFQKSCVIIIFILIYCPLFKNSLIKN